MGTRTFSIPVLLFFFHGRGKYIRQYEVKFVFFAGGRGSRASFPIVKPLFYFVVFISGEIQHELIRRDVLNKTGFFLRFIASG